MLCGLVRSYLYTARIKVRSKELPFIYVTKVAGEAVRDGNLTDRVEREDEGCFRNLFIRVFVPVSQAWQATDPHYDNSIPHVKLHTRRGFRDWHVEAEPLTHRFDGRLMGGVAARDHSLCHDSCHLFDLDDLSVDHQVLIAEHGVGKSKAKEGAEGLVHGFLLHSSRLQYAAVR